MRGVTVVLMAFAVVATGYAALTMLNTRRLLVEHGIGSLFGTGTLALSATVFLFCTWHFLGSLRSAISEWPTAPSSEMTPRNLRVHFYKAFTEPSKDVNPAYRWGMLTVVLLLLAWNINFLLNLSPAYSGERYMNLVVVLMLLFNHLAGSFRFPPTVTLAVRVLAYGWVVLGCAYFFVLL